jgi:hypothetical protein
MVATIQDIRAIFSKKMRGSGKGQIIQVLAG